MKSLIDILFYGVSPDRITFTSKVNTIISEIATESASFVCKEIMQFYEMTGSFLAKVCELMVKQSNCVVRYIGNISVRQKFLPIDFSLGAFQSDAINNRLAIFNNGGC